MSQNNRFHDRLQTSWVLLVVLTMLLSGCGGAAKESKKYRVGILAGLNAFSPAVDGFKSKMTELGFVEGENISYDVQSTNVDFAAYEAITKKFVTDKVDLIFVFPTEATMSAKAATKGTDIPIVFAMVFTDVPGLEIVKSVREPGGNITGVNIGTANLAGKRLEILLELAPNAKRILVPYLRDYPNVPGQLDVIRSMAGSRGITLVEFAADTPQALQTKMDSFVAADGIAIDAILMLAEPLGITPDFYTILGKFAYEHKTPIGGAAMSIGEDYPSVFGLLPDPNTVGQQSALLADKIFEGTPAGSIPVITPENYFQINYKAAQTLGITVPIALLKQANKIIK